MSDTYDPYVMVPFAGAMYVPLNDVPRDADRDTLFGLALDAIEEADLAFRTPDGKHYATNGVDVHEFDYYPVMSEGTVRYYSTDRMEVGED